MRPNVTRTSFLSLAALAVPALAQDLNGNGVDDPYELRAGGGQDCNHNGFVDESDVSTLHMRLSIEHLNGVEGFQNNVWTVTPIDFDQNGRPDLAVTSMMSTNVGALSLWRNEGGPGLVHVIRYTFPGTRPWALRAADVDADGRPDLVASDASFNRAYVFFADGPASFAPPVVLEGPSSNNGSLGLDVADLDGDGDVDVVFSSWGLYTINVFLNDGRGRFSGPQSFPTDAFPFDVAIRDFTGDGRPDVAVATDGTGSPSENGTVTLLENLGEGAFVKLASVVMPPGRDPFPGKALPQHVELCDTDHDGDTDLITSSRDSNVLSIHANDGTGRFTLSQSFGGIAIESDARGLAVADLNGDGWEEICWGDPDMAIVGVYENVQGVFEFHQNYACANYGAFTVAVADFSLDGRPDLVASNETSRSFSVLVNEGELDFAAPIHLRPETYPDDGVLADFDGDGLTDLFLTNLSLGPQRLSVYRGLGAAVFAKRAIETPVTTTGGFFQAADVDEDGDQDILLVGGPQAVYLGNGDGTFAPPLSSGLIVTTRYVLVDLNGDGHLDLAWLYPGHPSLLRVSFGNGTGMFGAYTEYVDVAEEEAIGVGDVTGDGAPEIFSGHRAGIFSIHPNLGDGTFGTRRDIVVTGSPFHPTINAIASADFDVDGDNDVVVSGFGLQMFFNPGDGDLPGAPVTVATAGASILIPVDVDLDGVPDMYGRAGGPHVFRNGGGGSFQDILLENYDSSARTMMVGDANNDGRSDVLIGPENSWGEYLYLNLPPVSTDANGNGIPDECEPRARLMRQRGDFGR